MIVGSFAECVENHFRDSASLLEDPDDLIEDLAQAFADSD